MKFTFHPYSWHVRTLAQAVGAVILVCGAATSTLHAELTWTQKTVELHAQANDAVLEARFPFTNGGARPVEIREVQSSCGCTTVTPSQRHFDPGQSGEIVARFTIGERVGLQKKTILVSTSDQPVATALTLVVHIPELARVQPASVIWKQGELPAAKTIELVALQDALPIGEITVQSSNPGVTAELQPGSDGHKFQVRVTPLMTDRTLFAALTIRCRVGKEAKTFRAFAAVQAPPPGPSRAAPGTPAAGGVSVAPASIMPMSAPGQ